MTLPVRAMLMARAFRSDCIERGSTMALLNTITCSVVLLIALFFVMMIFGDGGASIPVL